MCPSKNALMAWPCRWDLSLLPQELRSSARVTRTCHDQAYATDRSDWGGHLCHSRRDGLAICAVHGCRSSGWQTGSRYRMKLGSFEVTIVTDGARIGLPPFFREISSCCRSLTSDTTGAWSIGGANRAASAHQGHLRRSAFVKDQPYGDSSHRQANARSSSHLIDKSNRKCLSSQKPTQKPAA